MIRPRMRKAWRWLMLTQFVVALLAMTNWVFVRLGCLLLLLTYAFLWVGFATALLLSDSDDGGVIAIGTACVVGAGAAYAARVGFEDGGWERLYMPALPALLAAVFAVYGIANEEKITVLEVSLGFGWTLLVGVVLAFPCTCFHLCARRWWNRNRS